MLTSSAKQKGRKLQQFVRDTLRMIFRGILEDGDIESRQMSGAGQDIVLSPTAKKYIKLAIECKQQEKLNLWSAIEQAEQNAEEGQIPCVVFGRNRSKTYIVLEMSNFVNIYKSSLHITERVPRNDDRNQEKTEKDASKNETI